MNKYFFLLVVAIIGLGVSCRKGPGVSSYVLSDTTGFAELEKFKVNEIDFTYFHFKSKVDYANGKDNQSFTVNGRIKKDSVIWLSVTPGLGIEAVRCMILKDSVMLLDRIHNKYYGYGFSYINQTFNTNLSYENLEAMIVGNLITPKNTATDKLVKKKSLGFYLLRQNRERIKIDNFVSVQNLKVESVEVLNTVDNSSLYVKYDEFVPLDSFLIANHIKAVIKFADEKGKEQNTIVDIRHAKAEIVSKPLNFPFNVPKRFEDK